MKILFAKINPVAEIPQIGDSPFSQQVLVGDHVTAIAINYGMGTDKSSFNVIFGKAEFNPLGGMSAFKRVANSIVELTADGLQDWGTDDRVILSKLCEKLGTTAVEFIEGEFAGYDF